MNFSCAQHRLLVPLLRLQHLTNRRSHGQWDLIQPAQLFPALSAVFSHLWLLYALQRFIQLQKSKWKKSPHFLKLRSPTCICRGRMPIPPVLLSCNLILSKSIFRPSYQDGATEMGVFQVVLERLTEFIAYTLPHCHLCRWCLYGCIQRKKSSMGRWEMCLCLLPAAQSCHTLGAVCTATWFEHELFTCCSCLGFRFHLCYFCVCLPKIFVATPKIKVA